MKAQEIVQAMHLYRDPDNLLPFQVQDILRLYEVGPGVLSWDTGMGKSRGLLALACLLLGADHIDHVLLVCEQNKLSPAEWEADLATLTTATWARYHGAKRGRVLEQGLPQIIATTYETAREDIAVRDADGVLLGDGPLTRALTGRRVLVVYDEMPRLAKDSSGLYQAHSHLVERIGATVIGMTATPFTTDYESVYNIFMLVCPWLLPDREAFEELCVLRRSKRSGRPTFDEDAVRRHLLAPIRRHLLRRRKTDLEVRHLFPVMHERTLHIAMSAEQAHAYQVIEQLRVAEAEDGVEVPGMRSVQRILASYPEALLAADGQLAADVVRVFGAEAIAAMRPGKLERLLALVSHAAAGGHKTVVFSFFATILPLLARDLEQIGVPVHLYHGQMTAKARREALQAFRSHDGPALLLSSDAGARGINIPEASRLVEWEGAPTYELGAQRRNRIHRLGSPHREVICATLMADGTVEQLIAERMLARNEGTDAVLGDESAAVDGFTTAAIRRSSMRVWNHSAAA